MNLEEITNEVNKLKYHIKILSETVDFQQYPVESLILSMNWDEQDINDAHDIFERYDEKIQNKEEINWREFEMELRNHFGIGYQTVKSIILAFYRNHQWTQVCYGYAMSFEPKTPVEFHSITRSKSSL